MPSVTWPGCVPGWTSSAAPSSTGGKSTRPRASRPEPRHTTSRSGSVPGPSGRAPPRGDRNGEAALWKRLSAARNAFAKRRKAYFATLEEEREGIKTRKEDLVRQAEELSSSTDWAGTATAYRELMRSWKQAGRADRATEDELWNRFKAAQDAFFAARSDVLDAKDRELRD